MPSTNIVEFLLQPKALLDQLVTLKSLISALLPLLFCGDCHQQTSWRRDIGCLDME